MEFDVSKEKNPKYLKKWYEYRISMWKRRPHGEKMVAHYKRLIKKL